MRQRVPDVSVKGYLPHAVAATLAVCVLPGALVFLYASIVPAPSVVLLAIFGGLLTLLVVGAGVALWSRRPESTEIAFGELIIWSWLRRKHAEDRLEEDVRLLGLDDPGKGKPASDIDVPTRFATLRDLAEALEITDSYTHGHSRRVERHVRRTAEALGVAEAELEELSKAAALHDVGKIRVPERVLRKPGPLTREERAIVEEHCAVGAELVSVSGNGKVADAVLHHHERWDGRGYPDGLAGWEIPLYARIIAVCDSYDAMTSTRPYRPSLGHEQALSVLREEAGSQFDPRIVEAFVETLPARVAVAALIPLTAFPGRLLRDLAVPVKRLSAGSLAPAGATLGAAVILGASLGLPLVPPRPPAVAADASTDPSARDPLQLDVDEQLDRVLSRRVEKRAAEPARARKSGTGGQRVRAAPASASPAQSAPAGAGTTATVPVPKPAPKPAPELAPVEESEPPDDPEPDEGRDCDNDDFEDDAEGSDHPGKGNGEGNDKHCD